MPIKEHGYVQKASINLRGLIISILLTVAILTGTNYYRTGLESQIIDAKNEISKSTAIISQSQEMERQLNERLKTSPAPAQIIEIDSIQNNLLEKMRLNDINIESITRIPAPLTQEMDSPPNGVEFDMTINGNWGAVMIFLNSMQKDSVLINLRQIVMEPVFNTNLIKVICRYKIYTE